jgi:hypothetical protein
MQSLYGMLHTLPDPRAAKGKRFPLAGVVTLVVMGLIAQQHSLCQLEAWVDGLDPSVGRALGFRFGRMPDYSTIRRVLLRVDADALAATITTWLHTVLTTVPVTDGPPLPPLPPEPMALDGKTLRGSADTDADLPALRILGTLVHDLGVSFGAQAIDATTNEVGTLPDLLTRLVLEGRLVTGDAHSTNRAGARLIREKGALSPESQRQPAAPAAGAGTLVCP